METAVWNNQILASAVACCDHCGARIYNPKDAIRVYATRDIIHKDCWLDYCGEHMFDLAETMDLPLPYDPDA